jgi:hypothetical protein
MREILTAQGVGVIVGKIEVGVKKIGVGVKKIGVSVGTGEMKGVVVGNAVGNGVWVGTKVGVVPGVGAVGTGVGEPTPGGGGVGGGLPLVGVGGIGKKVGVTSGNVGDNTGRDVVVGIGLVMSFEFFSHAQQPAAINRAARTPILRVRFLTVTSPLLLKRSKSRAGYKIDFPR